MKRCFAALALICALALSGVAQAEGTGMYLAPKFLMSIQNNYPTVEIGPNDVSEGYSQFTLGGALALGYDFNSQFGVPVRAEVEYALRGNSEKSWNYDNILDLKGAWNASTLFLNLYYDFRNSTAFTPYVGAGLGMAFNYANYTFSARGYNANFDDHRTTFAWNVGAGVAYDITDNFAVDLGYRYVNLGYYEVDLPEGGKVKNQPSNHEFMLGLRYTF